MMRVWRLSVGYIRPKSRTERPRKTKIGTEVGHVTRDLDTTVKVKGQGHRGGSILWRPPAQLVRSWQVFDDDVDRPGQLEEIPQWNMKDQTTDPLCTLYSAVSWCSHRALSLITLRMSNGSTQKCTAKEHC